MERTERDVERYLVRQIRKLGGKAYKFTSPGNVGVPDRVITLPDQTGFAAGQTYFVEVKRPGEKPRLIQKAVMSQMASYGANVAVVTSYGEVDMLCMQIFAKQKKIETAIKYAISNGVI